MVFLIEAISKETATRAYHHQHNNVQHQFWIILQNENCVFFYLIWLVPFSRFCVYSILEAKFSCSANYRMSRAHVSSQRRKRKRNMQNVRCAYTRPNNCFYVLAASVSALTLLTDPDIRKQERKLIDHSSHEPMPPSTFICATQFMSVTILLFKFLQKILKCIL